MKTERFLFSVGKQARVLAFLILLSFAGCGDDHQLGLPPQDDIPPSPPIVVSVDNLAGAAVIHFQAPAEYDILAITATFELNGVEHIVRASIFNSSLRVEGFGEVGEHTVFLRTVDTSRNESEPVAVTVSPLTPPVETIFETLEVRESFGGIRVSWENAEQNNIMVSVSVQDEFGIWNTIQSFFSSEPTGTGTVRGLDPRETAFRIQIRDRWDNFSQVYDFTGTPWFEEQLNRHRFREVIALPGDAPHSGNMFPSRMWNGNLVAAAEIFHTQTMPTPGWYVTFDLGQLAQLSRFRLWQRRGANHQFSFIHNNLRTYSMFGATEITAEMRATGSREGWTYLTTVNAHRPSGNPPGGPVTQEDRDFADQGEEIEIPLEAPPVRFIRIFMAETWGGGNIYQIQEIEFWGEVLETFF